MSTRIALYHDEASGERYEEKALNKTSTRFEKIGPKEMILEKLERYDVVFLPGAFPLKRHNKGGFFDFIAFLKRFYHIYRSDLLSYIKNGGGVIAVCASVGIMGKSIRFPILPTNLGIKTLGIFDYHAKYGPKTGIVDLEAVEYRKPPQAHKVVEDVLGDYSDDRFSSLYFRGPAITYDRRSDIYHPDLRSDDKTQELVVAKYVDDNPQLKGKGAIAYKELGEGKVISCSVHPEFSTWDLFDSMIDVVSE
ncbi:MAG: hypothetical protein R6V01_05590 [Thermoplasmatota archaeon]